MASSKLAVLETASAAYGFVANRFLEIVLVGIVPIGLASLLGYYVADLTTGWQLEVLNGKASPTSLPSRVLPVSIGLNVANVILIAVAAVAYHRMVLFDERGRLTLGRALMQFVLVTFLIFVIYIAGGFVLGLLAVPLAMAGSDLIVGIVPLALIVLMCWLGLRFAPAFPHIIATGRVELSYAWALTRHNTLRLLGAYLLVLLPLGIVTSALSFFVFDGFSNIAAINNPAALKELLESQREHLVGATLVGFVNSLLATALGVAVLSYAYKSLHGQPLHQPLQASET